MGRGRRWREPQPIYLREVREVGCNIFVSCANCNHSAEMALEAVEHLSGEMTLWDLAHLMRCTHCRCKGGVQPDSRPWIAHLRKTKQHDRLPYWACFVPEEGNA